MGVCGSEKINHVLINTIFLSAGISVTEDLGDLVFFCHTGVDVHFQEVTWCSCYETADVYLRMDYLCRNRIN